MQASAERITSLCTSIGHQTERGYIPSDDCQINLDELAYAIWHDDEALRNVSVQAYELCVFKRDLVPVIQVGEPLSYVALKALTAITYPPGPTVEDYTKHMNILSSYKLEASLHPELFAKVMEYLAPVIDTPIVDDESMNRAEMAVTFIRNIVVIPSGPDIHERIFKILDESLLFDVIPTLNIARMGERKVTFARLLCGILFGCFAPYLPFKDPVAPELPAQSPLLASFLEQQKTTPRGGSRHGHWGATVTVKGRFTTAPGPNILDKAPLPQAKHLRGRRMPYEAEKPVPPFTKAAEEAAKKVMAGRWFNLIFEKGFPKTFNAYDIGFSVRDQMHLGEMTRFFMEFIMKFKLEPRTAPLAGSATLGYFQSAALFWMESKAMTIGGVSALQALQGLCRVFASMSMFLSYVINEGKRESDVQEACDVVSKSAAVIEDVLVQFLAQKNLTKKPLAMLRDNVVAIERLFQLYAVAEKHELVRVKYTARDEEADDVLDDRISEKLDNFTSDLIIDRLAKRQDILTPFFVLLEHFDQLDDDALVSITKILEMFTKRRRGLAHLFKLPFFFVINKVWQDKEFARRADDVRDNLEKIFNVIVQKFFESAQRERTLFLQILTGVEVDDVYDEEAERRRQEEIVSQRLGISQEILSILDEKPAPASDNEEGEPAPEITYYQRHSDHSDQQDEPPSPNEPPVVGSDNEKPAPPLSSDSDLSSETEEEEPTKPIALANETQETAKPIVLVRETQEESGKEASESGDDLSLEDEF